MMKQLRRDSGPTSLMAGDGGDEYLGAAAHTGKKYSHIVVGADGATLTALTIRGVSVLAARGYNGVSLPAGYIICAGADDYFDTVTLSVGSAQGIRIPEDPHPVFASIAVADGTAEEAITATLTFTNAGGAGSLDLDVDIETEAGVSVMSYSSRQGTAKRIYFLKGTGLTVTIPGLAYPETAADGYVIRVRISGDENNQEVTDTFDVAAA